MKKDHSKGRKMTADKIFNLVNSAEFKQDIQILRKKFKIPMLGTSRNGVSLYRFSDSVSLDHFPPFNRTLSFDEKHVLGDLIREDVSLLCHKYRLLNQDFVQCIIPFLYLEDITKKEFYSLVDEFILELGLAIEPCSLLETSFFVSYSQIYSNNFEFDKKCNSYVVTDSFAEELFHDEEEQYLYNKKKFCNHADFFPVMLRISRTASLTQIVDYLTKNKEVLKELQKGDFVGESERQTRARTSHSKYNFVWRNRYVYPRKKLADLVNKKFHTKHDEIYVRNLISKISKKRNH